MENKTTVVYLHCIFLLNIDSNNKTFNLTIKVYYLNLSIRMYMMAKIKYKPKFKINRKPRIIFMICIMQT